MIPLVTLPLPVQLAPSEMIWYVTLREDSHAAEALADMPTELILTTRSSTGKQPSWVPATHHIPAVSSS